MMKQIAGILFAFFVLLIVAICAAAAFADEPTDVPAMLLIGTDVDTRSGQLYSAVIISGPYTPEACLAKQQEQPPSRPHERPTPWGSAMVVTIFDCVALHGDLRTWYDPWRPSLADYSKDGCWHHSNTGARHPLRGCRVV